MLMALFAPAIFEEFFFRVLLLPHPSENSSFGFLLSWIIISLFSFVVYHPLNGLLFSTSEQKIFIDPTFLILATGLGIFCTSLYLNSGSLWTPVVFHWTVVVVWLLCLGGNTKLTR
ncbi:CPBP family glutamic-type intramembrane protease [Myxosarcina sp. GI1(2024)]